LRTLQRVVVRRKKFWGTLQKKCFSERGGSMALFLG